MIAALLVVTLACLVFWLVFFRFKLIRLTPGWGIIFAFVVVHLMLVFLIGLRFITPYSTNATVVQRTIQLIPRLPEPTLVAAVLVDQLLTGLTGHLKAMWPVDQNAGAET
jgi:hypothetical protein